MFPEEVSTVFEDCNGNSAFLSAKLVLPITVSCIYSMQKYSWPLSSVCGLRDPEAF